MLKLINLFIILSLISCKEEKKVNIHFIQEKKVVKVEINHTIETFLILRSIAYDDPLYQYRDKNYKGKPIMFEARKYFSDYKNHKAVIETQKLLNTTSTTGDIILQGLLYFEELPAKSLKYQIDSDEWKNRIKTLTDYFHLLNQFYHEAKVYEFISKHSDFYNGAVSEAKSHLDDNLIPTMESYFGIENHAYKMILIPNSPFGMGFGASTKSKEGNVFYQIISPPNEEEWNENSIYNTFGFSGKGADEYYRDMVVHEFCHPFITPFLKQKKWKSEITKTDSLFIPILDSIMSKQGYGSWWGFVNEHIVRLGEIRVTKAMKVHKLDEMRKYNINENGFVLLPDAEELVIQYENNRSKYKNFQEFIPELIKQLNNFNKKEIEERINHI